MAKEKKYISNVEAILSRRYDNGADYWTTPDKRLIKESPFSMLDSILYLLELGIANSSILHSPQQLNKLKTWTLKIKSLTN